MATETKAQMEARHKKEKQAMVKRHRKALREQRNMLAVARKVRERLITQQTDSDRKIRRLSTMLENRNTAMRARATKAENSPDLIQNLIKRWIPDFNKAGVGVVVENGYVYAIKDSIEIKWNYEHVMKFGLQVMLRMFTPVPVTVDVPPENRVNGTIWTADEAENAK